MSNIIMVKHPEQKAAIVQHILLQLPDWFGLPDSTAEYIEQSRELPVWAAFDNDQPVGFISLQRTCPRTVEVHCMGVLPYLHRRGTGRALMEAAKSHCLRQGDLLMQVKTVDAGHYAAYDRTIAFYEAMSFIRLEVVPTLWDEWNPCLVLVMPLV